MGARSLILAASLACLSLPAVAVNMFVEGGIHLGGDTLADTTSGEKIKAGQLLGLSIGAYADLSDSMQGRLSLGYKFDAIDADNGDASFTRFPVEILAMHKSGKFMFGGGIAYHLSPEFDFNVAPSYVIKFDDALGFVLAFDYNSKGEFARDWYLGGRVTLIDYEVPGLTISGNSIGAVIGFMF